MNEQTPLIQTVVVTYREPRYPHSTLRRFCTILLGCSLILLSIGFLVPFAILPHRHHNPHFHNPLRDVPHDWISSTFLPNPQGISFEEVASILMSTPSEDNVREWSKYYTSGPHLAGKNLSQALWTRDRWEEAGVKSEVVAYDVYINYPVDHRLALLKDDKVEFECTLEEDVLEEDPTTALEDRIPTFHGYSATGNVTAPYVFVNWGTYDDFDDLLKANVSLKGKIAVAKYGQNFRGLKTQRAQELGMIGIVIYSDPDEDGNITEENGYKPYPEGPARNPSAVQRGSTQFLSTLPGDPTTPGYPSKPGVPRADPYVAIPRIPSLPISYKEAIPILKALNGHGPKGSDFGNRWHGGGLKYKGVDYNIGPSPDSLTLNLVNVQDYVTTPIWNVIGIINGTISDEVIVLGNHRDAWIAGGAGDPHSGSAAFIELVRGFGQAIEAGWKPLRTIVFASWDGEEYGLLGSTEWVEEYVPWLSSSAIAYLNVDVATHGGKKFKAASAPLLNHLLKEVTSIVGAPQGGTVRDHWDGEIRTIGSGSDFVAFLDLVGIPSVDLSYETSADDPVYHYHSNYDSFHWMDKFGDPTWEYQASMARIWALMAANLAYMPVIPLNATEYAISLKSYIYKAKQKAETSLQSESFNFDRLDSALARLHLSATAFDAYTADLTVQLAKDYPWYKLWKKALVLYRIRQANIKYKGLERAFLYSEGLDNRTWFKHVVFAPGRWTGYSGETFPGLMESFTDKNVTNAWRWSGIIEEKLASAASLLE